MTLNQFAIFAAIAKHHNVTRASAELRVSQPWVSQQLHMLESSYGVKLCQTSRRGVELTATGREFLKKVESILEQVAHLKSAVNRSDVPAPRPKPERLEIGATSGSSTSLFPELFSRFRKKHRDIQINFIVRDAFQLEKLLLGSPLELGTTTRLPRSPDVAWEPFLPQKMVLFVLSNHALAAKQRVTLAEVLKYPLVLRSARGERGRTEELVKEFTAQGLQIKVGMVCETPEAIKLGVRGSMGVGLVFEDVVRVEAKNGEFKILHVEGLKMHGESFIIYPKNKTLSPPAQEFLELLRSIRRKSEHREFLQDQEPVYVNGNSHNLSRRGGVGWQPSASH
jgi:DNA-binding transcriptional LysR family regulator